MADNRILLVEDDDSLREVVAFNLSEGGFAVDTAPNGKEALACYHSERHSVVLTDLKMPGIDGLELLRRLRKREAGAVVVMMTAHGTLDTAVTAMQEGAFHYVEKPVNNRTLLAVLHRAVEHSHLGRENEALRHAADGGARPDKLIISTSPAMNNVLRLVDKVADSDATITILGESGTGKELIARAIHERSSRRARPFVTVNCAAIPPDLLESLLFGHAKGAFTGATQASQGKFAAADRGTLFLDEIGEMSAGLQSKLLRVLQEGEVDVVGSNQPRAVDVRVLSATNQNLEKLVAEGSFRNDLYYRLNVIPITIPPLRARREDIPVLFRHFIRKHGRGLSFSVAPEVDDCLLRHEWPGNVRELENLTERMLLLSEGQTLGKVDVPAAIRQVARPDSAELSTLPKEGLPFDLPEDGLDLMDLERRIIQAALDRAGGNQSAAARYLSIPRHVLLYRMEKYGIR